MRSPEPGPWPWAEASYLTDRGARSPCDQGRALVSRRRGLVAVAHGMGGSDSTGLLGAEAVVDALGEWVTEGGAVLGGDEGHPEDHPAVVALRAAHARIRALPERDRRYQGIRAVASVVVAGRDSALVAHVGDVRVYRLRGERLEPLTTDHSLAGASPPVVTRALGLSDEAGVEVRRVERQPGDLFVLCSHGLGEVVDEDTLVDLLTWRHSPPTDAGTFTAPTLAETCQWLVREASRAGAPHNLAVALARG